MPTFHSFRQLLACLPFLLIWTVPCTGLCVQVDGNKLTVEQQSDDSETADDVADGVSATDGSPDISDTRRQKLVQKILDQLTARQLAILLPVWEDRARFFELNDDQVKELHLKLEEEAKAIVEVHQARLNAEFETILPSIAWTTFDLDGRLSTFDGEEQSEATFATTIDAQEDGFRMSFFLKNGTHTMISLNPETDLDSLELMVRLLPEVDSEKMTAYTQYANVRVRQNVVRSMIAIFALKMELSDDQIEPMRELLLEKIETPLSGNVFRAVRIHKDSLPDEPPEFLTELQKEWWRFWKANEE